MQGVILDKNSFGKNDIDLDILEVPPICWKYYPSTKPDQTLKRIHNCEVVITNKVVLNKQVIESAPKLQLILIAATGTDNVDLKTCKAHGITVCNVRHYATPAVAQHTITLMLNLLTNQLKYIQDVQQGLWCKSDVFCLLNHPVIETQGKTLGIIGFGTLGKKVAEIAQAMGMEILITHRPGTTNQDDIHRVTFDQLLERSDVISIHCPLTSDTLKLFKDEEFKKMKNSALLINTARGPIIDSLSLITALKNGEIAGAGIDVFDQEPPPADHPLLAEEIPNLLITPHNAWASRETRQRLVEHLSNNLKAWLSNQPINKVETN